ncbi:monovalent cation/H(+) antiporter subunit G [Roseococcus sp. DSY-14]|uniref:monovalent cation/H(+) antiporter subunit G n=1 Tax=Roseococcus sp. DSY-14 TaxID=3369650 RepID=UPI00387A889C
MTEALAALLLVLGAAIALVAAIGVARLPDAFLRMHAATKAGVVGAGLMLLGAGLAFNSGEAWLRVGLIVLFLLVTVPISSHALGRAAYIGGAPLWPGSGEDALADVLPRHAIDHPSARVNPAEEGPAMLASAVATARARRILVALAQGDASEAALLAAIDAAAEQSSEITLLSLLCAPSLSRTGPVPLGGAHYARRLVEKRMATAREGTAALAGRLQAACEARALAFSVRHEEGDALQLLERAAAHHDLTLLPRAAWFDQALVLPAGMAEARARGIAVSGLLIIGADFKAPRELHLLHEGDAASGEALKRLLAAGTFTECPLTITALDVPGAAATLADAVALAASHGRRARAGHALLHPDHPVPQAAFGGATLAVIPARSASGSGAWRSLREGSQSVLLT